MSTQQDLAHAEWAGSTRAVCRSRRQDLPRDRVPGALHPRLSRGQTAEPGPGPPVRRPASIGPPARDDRAVDPETATRAEEKLPNSPSRLPWASPGPASTVMQPAPWTKSLPGPADAPARSRATARVASLNGLQEGDQQGDQEGDGEGFAASLVPQTRGRA